MTQDPQTAQAYNDATTGASALRLAEQPGSGGSFVGSVTALGEGSDIAATAGATPGSSWVVLPTVAGDPSTPGMVVTNPGTSAASVTLHVLAAGGPNDVTIDVSAGSSASVPPAFLSADTTAGILVTATTGEVIPAGASQSLGRNGIAGYAIAVGVPIPKAP
jgi:hypothetical protein